MKVAVVGWHVEYVTLLPRRVGQDKFVDSLAYRSVLKRQNEKIYCILIERSLEFT